ncbi:MAG TPA: hypothetical protein VGP50_02985 [Stellaceae bacterium]|jgi:hypothetical protein|nr:hypothetical protein [Stellaceae bacterium]
MHGTDSAASLSAANSRVWIALACAVALHAAPSPAWAWGATGHRLISRLAVETLPEEVPAFLRSADALWPIGELGREADRSKTAGAEHDADRDPGHRINPSDDQTAAGVALTPLTPTREAFDTALRAKGSDQYKMGYLPYAIIEGWQQLKMDFAYWRVNALGERAGKSAEDREWFAKDKRLREMLTLRDLGYWSHFVADASMPLHVSIHYLGWGNFPNPQGYSTALTLHAHTEGDFVAHHVSEEDMRATLRPYRDCGCSIEERAVAHILASHAQLIPLYELDKRNAFDGAHDEGREFVAERLAAAAAELRDMVVDAWRASPDATVGYPNVKLRDVEAGKVLPIEELKGRD